MQAAFMKYKAKSLPGLLLPFLILHNHTNALNYVQKECKLSILYKIASAKVR